MLKKLLLIFLSVFCLSYLLIQVFFKKLAQDQQLADSHNTSIIQENVRDRFRLYLDLPISIGVLGAEHFSTGNIKEIKYWKNAETLLTMHSEFLGLNVVDADGAIVQVFPHVDNFRAIGRITQNHQKLLSSYAAGDPYWFSPPFKLFQSKNGFIFYFPIIEGRTLKGWFATVLSSEIFFEKFKLTEFLSSYELIIKDEASGMNYFETSAAPPEGRKVYESTAILKGRKMIFQSWLKEDVQYLTYPWYWSVLMALILASLAAVIVKLYENRKLAQAQLRDIGVLLNMTSKEAVNSLVVLHSDNKNTETQRNIEYIRNLIEQIDLLQSMTHTGKDTQVEDVNLSELLKIQIEEYRDILEKKDLRIIFKEPVNATVCANRWLLEKSVFSNILSHSLIYSQPNSSIEIGVLTTPTSHFISIHAEKILQNELEITALKVDRRLEVAQRILQMYKGELYIQKDFTSGLIIRVVMNREA